MVCAEELYDHVNDPREWVNLAGDPNYAAIKTAHAGWVPSHWARGAPGKGAYTFNPHTYQWTHED